MGRGRDAMVVPALCAALIMLAAGSLFAGPAALSPAEVVAGLVSDGPAGVIVREIRAPRTLLAILIGAGLGLAGAATQGVFRNPLAEPATLGASGLAAFAAVAVIAAGGAGTLSFALPLAAAGGALCGGLALALVARRSGDPVGVLLTGLALATLSGAGVTLVLSLSSNPFAIADIVFWLMGSLEDRSLRHVAIAAPFVLAGAAALAAQGSALRALSLGEETALSLGHDPARTAALVSLGAAFVVGGMVAVAGAIGFVGLVAPALARPLIGHDPSRALAPAALIGAILLLAADVAVRLIPTPSELKVGVVTALIGAPVFLWIVWTRRSGFGGGP